MTLVIIKLFIIAHTQRMVVVVYNCSFGRLSNKSKKGSAAPRRRTPHTTVYRVRAFRTRHGSVVGTSYYDREARSKIVIS